MERWGTTEGDRDTPKRGRWEIQQLPAKHFGMSINKVRDSYGKAGELLNVSHEGRIIPTRFLVEFITLFRTCLGIPLESM